jgi:uncharacterized oxidoreductase
MTEPATIDHRELRQLARAIFVATGSNDREAEIVSDHLVEANLRGHDSHGVGLIPTYVRDRKAGHLHPNRHPHLVSENGALALFDAMNGYGHVAAHEVTDWAVGRARTDGVAVVGLRNSHHIARVGTYGEQACEAGLVAIAFANVFAGRQIVAPFGGSDGRLHTNPICIAVPAGARRPAFILDFATSQIAMGKVRVAYNKGAAVEPGILIDSVGVPTTDPAALFEEPLGALLSFGGHKGSGLAVMCELLAGALVGGPTNRTVDPPPRGLMNNMLLILIDPARFADLAVFHGEVEAILAHVKASPSRDPSRHVLVAGEPELATRAGRLAHGIPLDARSWNDILVVARNVGASPVEGRSAGGDAPAAMS